MRRRLFDHFFAELCVALNSRVPRYPLWLALGELGEDPDFLTREGLLRFLDQGLAEFLAEHDLLLPDSAERRMRRRSLALDPRYPTPYEHMSRLASSFSDG